MSPLLTRNAAAGVPLLAGSYLRRIGWRPNDGLWVTLVAVVVALLVGFFAGVAL